MYGRKAFGHQRPMSPAVKARNVAQSIQANELKLTPETWTRYGLESNPSQQALVRKALNQMTKDALDDYLAGHTA